MPDSENKKSPSEELAAKIAKRLFDEGFIGEGHNSQLQTKLNEPSGVSQNDWKLWITAAMSTDSNGGDDE